MAKNDEHGKKRRRRRSGRGFIRRRREGLYSVGVTLGSDPATGKLQQVTEQVRGDRKAAEAALTALLSKFDSGALVPHSDTKLEGWVTQWLQLVAVRCRRNTHSLYTHIANAIIVPALGPGRELHEIRPQHCSKFLTDLSGRVKRRSALTYFTVLKVCLEDARVLGLIARNPAKDVDVRRTLPVEKRAVKRAELWDEPTMKKFIDYVKANEPVRVAALYAVALHSGCRRNELLALRWADIDWATHTIHVTRQLSQLPVCNEDGSWTEPTFGELKAGPERDIELHPETMQLLARHRAEQREFVLRNGRVRTCDLVWVRQAEEAAAMPHTLGWPLDPGRTSFREFHKLTNAAGVKAIKFHGLRHIHATLLLSKGVPPHVVQRRLGHTRIEQTLGTYAHVMKVQESNAGEVMGKLLHG
jgi:integrase